MPTPSVPSVAQSNLIATLIRSVHATCPPEDDRPRAAARDDSDVAAVNSDGSVEDSAAGSPDEDRSSSSSSTHRRDNSESEMTRDSPSPVSAIEDVKRNTPQLGSLHSLQHSADALSPLNQRPHILQQARYAPSFLRHGSKFVGTQRSENQKYNVQVDIKHVDMAESTICGYLRIEGLTTDHPTLTTFFEGEMIGTKYTFQTRHPEWGSTEKVDMQHWNQFPEWRPLAKAARRSDFSLKNFADRENIFMRWKERFLVPDHSVRTINGASFEGFYYICFNQLSGNIDGIYFHHKSEKFQQLKLKHVDDRGCYGAIEFR